MAKFYPPRTRGDSDSFLGRRNLQIAFRLPRRLLKRLAVVPLSETIVLPDFPSKTGLPLQREHLYRPAWIIPLRPAPDSNLAKCRNINLLAIGYPRRYVGAHLRHRLTPRRRTLRGKPWASGRPDSHRASATHSGILTSQRSSPPYSEPSPPWERSPTNPAERGSPSSVELLASVNFRGKTPRPVSCYAFFKGWQLLSQPPGCLRNFTPFNT